MVISMFKKFKTTWIYSKGTKRMDEIKKSTKYLKIERVVEENPDWQGGSCILHKLNTNLRWEIPPTEWGVHKTNKDRILGGKKTISLSKKQQ